MKEYTVIYEHGANNWSAYAPDPSNRSRHSFRVSTMTASPRQPGGCRDDSRTNCQARV